MDLMLIGVDWCDEKCDKFNFEEVFVDIGDYVDFVLSVFMIWLMVWLIMFFVFCFVRCLFVMWCWWFCVVMRIFYEFVIVLYWGVIVLIFLSWNRLELIWRNVIVRFWSVDWSWWEWLCCFLVFWLRVVGWCWVSKGCVVWFLWC